MQEQRPTAIDLFAGAGGMALGFEQAGFDIIGAIDIDPIHCATYEYNYPLWYILCADAREIRGGDILQLADLTHEQVDVVFGGPPCEGFSVAGKRDIDDPRNALVFHFLRLVLEVQPKYFVMENVPGLVAGTHKKFLAEVLERYRTNGYNVPAFQQLDAADFGVPQRRRRVFLIGSRQDQPVASYPNPDHRAIDEVNGRHNMPKTPTVWDAIGDLPEIEKHPELLERDWLTDVPHPAGSYARRLDGMTRDPHDFSYPRVWDDSVLTGMARTRHGPNAIADFRATEWGHVEPKSHLFRLHPNGLCNTLRAGTPSDRGSFTAARPIHPYKPRCITVREAARLHSFPDWFRFHATKWHGFRQIGNSVPPLLARALAAGVMNALGKKPTRPRKKIRLPPESHLLTFNMTEAAKWFAVDRCVIEPRCRRSPESTVANSSHS